MSIEDTKTAVGIMHQFERIADASIFPLMQQGRPTNALTAFFERISQEDRIVYALKNYNTLTYDLTQLFIAYYEWLLVNSYGHTRELNIINEVARLLKAMEINTPYNENLGRMFVWLDRGDRMSAVQMLPKDYKPAGKVKEYTGRASRKVKEEPEGPLDNPKATLHIYEFKHVVADMPMNVWYWQLNFGKHRTGGAAGSLEAAAEACYRCFYKNMTILKFDAALKPERHKHIMLLGNWITSEQFHESHPRVIPDVATDDRDRMMFAIGYKNNLKEKALVLPKDITPTTKIKSNNPFDHRVLFQSKVELESSLDWYIHKPEQYVKGEVSCMKCASVGTVDNCMMLHVRGRGALCGPCINHLIEVENLDDTLYDL